MTWQLALMIKNRDKKKQFRKTKLLERVDKTNRNYSSVLISSVGIATGASATFFTTGWLRLS
jgi:hypothetical protein